MPMHVLIHFDDPFLDKADEHYCNYDFEGESGERRTLRCASTPFWVSLCDHLIEFFGGKISYHDLDAERVWDREVSPPPYALNSAGRSAEEAAAWEEFQRKKAGLRPIKSMHLVDGRHAGKVSAY